MDIQQKTKIVSLLVLVGSIALSAILYFMFHIVFIFVIFIPPVIYYFLKKRERNGSQEISDRFGNFN